MRALNTRQQEALAAIVASEHGLPFAKLDGRSLRPLRSRGLILQVDDMVHATVAGVRSIQSPLEESLPTAEASAVQSASVSPDEALPQPQENAPRADDDAHELTPRIRRLKAIYQMVSGPSATDADNQEYALNVAFLVADALQTQGMGNQVCGSELWREFLRVTSYWEQKEAQQIARIGLQADVPPQAAAPDPPRPHPAHPSRLRRRMRR